MREDGVEPVADSRVGAAALRRWVEAQEKDHIPIGRENEAEPNTIEITYTKGGFEETRFQQNEVVFEDPNECEKRPRLLVSLQSVLALKALCEREFGRVEALTEQLVNCRTAYFKELLWLREQLIIASNPDKQVVWDEVMSYEVYWYDPPSYVDAELKDFMLDCNRITNKRLIEENYELRLALGGNVKKVEKDPDEVVKEAIKKMGTNRLVKRMYAILGTKEFGGAPSQKEFADVCKEVLGIKEAPKLPDKDGRDDQIANLLKEIESLKAVAESVEELRKAYKTAQKELEEQKKLVEKERARADAERERAEAERQRAAHAEQLIKDMQAQGSNKSMTEAMQQVLDKAAGAIKKSTEELAKKMNITASLAPPSSTKPSKESSAAGASGIKLETAVQSLQKLAGMKPNIQAEKVEVVKEVVTTKGDNSGLQSRIKDLERQLKEALEAVEAAKAETEAIRAASEKALEEARRQSASGGASVGPPPPQPEEQKNRPGRDQSQLVADLEAKLEAMRKKNEELKRQVEEYKELEAQYQKDLDKLRAERKKLQAVNPPKEDGGDLQKRLAEAQDQIEQMAMKLTAAQEKIAFLKEELKRYKRMAGEEVNSDDDSDWDLDGSGMPKFLIHYFRRIKNSPKPRWMHLSEDAKLATQKRHWLFSSKTRVVDTQSKPHFMPDVAGVLRAEGPLANAAFDFLRGNEAGRQLAGEQPRGRSAGSGGGTSRSPDAALGNQYGGKATAAVLSGVAATLAATAAAAAGAPVKEEEDDDDEGPPMYIVKPGYTISPYIRVSRKKKDGTSRSTSPPDGSPARSASAHDSPSPVVVASASASAASAAAAAVSTRLPVTRGRSSSPTSSPSAAPRPKPVTPPSPTPSLPSAPTADGSLALVVGSGGSSSRAGGARRGQLAEVGTRSAPSKALLSDVAAVAGLSPNVKAWVGAVARNEVGGGLPPPRHMSASAFTASAAPRMQEQLQSASGWTAVPRQQQHPLLHGGGAVSAVSLDTEVPSSDAVAKSLRAAALQVGAASVAVVSTAASAAAAASVQGDLAKPAASANATLGSQWEPVMPAVPAGATGGPSNPSGFGSTAAPKLAIQVGSANSTATSGLHVPGPRSPGAASLAVQEGGPKTPSKAVHPLGVARDPTSPSQRHVVGGGGGWSQLQAQSASSPSGGSGAATSPAVHLSPPEAIGMEGKPAAPVRRVFPANQRAEQMFSRSRSTGSLPLTNAGKTMATSSRRPGVAQASATEESGVDDSVLPGVLPQLPPGRVKKQAPQPYWPGAP